MKALKVYLILFSFLFSLSGFAFDFEKDGIYYNILSEDDKTAEVTSGDVAYTGDIVIPFEVNGYSVTEIGEHAFEYSTITSVNIPSSVIRIKKNAFCECKGLTSVVIPSKQIVISPYAFMYCENLVSLTIFGEVKSIGSKAFSYCTSLKDIYLHARTVKKDFSVQNNTFSNVSGDIITHVYNGMEEMYSYYGRGMGFPHIVGDLVFQVFDGEVYTDTITQKLGEIGYVRNFENTNWQPLYVPFDINYLDVKDEFEIAKIENVHLQLRRIHTNGVIDENKYTLCVSCKLLDKEKNNEAWHNRPYLIKPKKTGTINASLVGQSLVKYKEVTDDEWKERVDSSGVTIYPSSEDTISRMIVKDHNVVFKGTYSGVSAAEMVANNYLTLKDSKICVPAEDMDALSPMRWYMSFENKSSEIGYVMFFIHDAEGNTVDYFESKILSDDNTTGISEAESQATSISDIFTLDGRKTDGKNLKSGIYIKNGKKYIVK